jgi:hypothetical protein
MRNAVDLGRLHGHQAELAAERLGDLTVAHSSVGAGGFGGPAC